MRKGTQAGYIFEANNSFHIRFNVHQNGTRVQRSRKLCPKDDLHTSITDHSVLKLAEDLLLKVNAINVANTATPHHVCAVCGMRRRRIRQRKFATAAHGE